MNILIIEDDQNKLNQIVEFLRNKLPDATINETRSFQSGMKEIVKSIHNLIILDMSMPSFDISPQESGGRPRSFAGKEILRQMDRRRLKVPVIVMTQFETFGDNSISLSELCSELEKLHPNNYTGTVYYNAALNNWKDDLDELLKNIN